MERQPGEGSGASSHDLSPKQFIMTGLPRTGVTYIAMALKQTDGVKLHGEVLREVGRRGGIPNPTGYHEFRALSGKARRSLHPRRDRLAYVDMLLTPTEEAPVAGLKLLPLDWCWPKRDIYWSPTLVRAARMPKLREYVISNDITVLHFVRENILKLLVSNALASRDQSWSSRQPRTNEKIQLDPRDVKKKLTWLERTQQDLIDLCKDFSTVTIPYELPSEQKLLMAKDALGITSTVELQRALSKQTSDDLRDVIENYDEITQVLAGSRYERFL